MKRPSSLRHGFTIVELIIVVAVIAILAALVAVGYNGIQTSARDRALLSDIDSVESELARYASRNGGTYGAGLNWDSSSGVNSNIVFTPTDGNIIVVTTTETTYCIKAYNVRSNSKTLDTAQTKGVCALAWKMLARGMTNHMCAIASNDDAYCWGANTNGQLGNNTSTTSLLPAAVYKSGVLSGKTIKQIAAGTNHTCVVASDDNAYCWGANARGQLGNNSTTQSLEAVAVNKAGVLAGKTIKKISTGQFNTCVVASDNKAYCWGANGYGNLGNNSTTDALVPVAVSVSGVLAGKNITEISTGTSNACVTDTAGLAYCWGSDADGQLGNGTSLTDSYVPVAVTATGVLSGKSVVGINVGWYNACARTADSLAFCWGQNAFGELGNNSTTTAPNPVAVYTAGVLSGKTIKDLSMGFDHACVIASDDKAYCWGANASGRLGNNSMTDSSQAVTVTATGVLSGKSIKDISATGVNGCAISTDNQAYCWGAANGLGNGATALSRVPVLVTPPYSS